MIFFEYDIYGEMYNIDDVDDEDYNDKFKKSIKSTNLKPIEYVELMFVFRYCNFK